MAKNRENLILFALAAGAILLSGCAKNAQNSLGSFNASTGGDAAAVVDSMLSAMNSSMNDVEQAPSYVYNNLAMPSLRGLASASCGISRFTPPIGSTSCSGTASNDTVSANFSSCTAGSHDEYTLNGLVLLSFDSPTTCNSWIASTSLPTSGTVTRTSANFTRTNPDGTTVTTVSTPAQNYLGKSIQGGAQTAFAQGSRTITIFGLNRQKKAANGSSVLFDHSIYTTTPLTVTGIRALNNRTVQSGTIQVDHNVARYSATAAIAGLAWGTSCCYPTTGSVTFNYTGSIKGSFAVNFNTGTCGVANVNAGGLSTQVTLAACD